MEQNEARSRLAENLKRLRKTRRLTQLALAEKAGISEDMVKSIELRRAWPSDRTISQISVALETDIILLFAPAALSCAQKVETANAVRRAVCSVARDYIQNILGEFCED